MLVFSEIISSKNYWVYSYPGFGSRFIFGKKILIKFDFLKLDTKIPFFWTELRIQTCFNKSGSDWLVITSGYEVSVISCKYCTGTVHIAQINY